MLRIARGVAKRTRDYLAHDLPELVLPSSLPEPKSEFLRLTAMERMRVRLHAFRLAYRDYKNDRAGDYKEIYASLRPKPEDAQEPVRERIVIPPQPVDSNERHRSSQEASTSATENSASKFSDLSISNISRENVDELARSAAAAGQAARVIAEQRAAEIKDTWRQEDLGGEMSQTAKAGLSLLQKGVPRAREIVDQFLGGYKQGLEDAARSDSPFASIFTASEAPSSAEGRARREGDGLGLGRGNANDDAAGAGGEGLRVDATGKGAAMSDSDLPGSGQSPASAMGTTGTAGMRGSEENGPGVRGGSG